MTLTKGTTIQYEATSSSIGNVVALSATKAVAVYVLSAANDLVAQVLDIEGLTVTANSRQSVDTDASESSWSAAVLSSTKVIVVYTQGTGLHDILARILTISGSTITVGASSIVAVSGNRNQNSTAMDVTALSSIAAILAFRDGDNSQRGTATALDISGDTISPGAAHVYETDTAFTTRLDTLIGSNSQAIVTYLDGGSSNRGAAIILTKTGAVMTSGVQTLFTAAAITNSRVTAIDTDKALVAYQNGSDELESQVLSISGTTITSNAVAVIDAATISGPQSLSVVDVTTVVCLYGKLVNNTYAVEILVSGVVTSGDTPLEVDTTTGGSRDSYTNVSPDAIAIFGAEEAAILRSSNALNPKDLDIALMQKSVDVDADGTFLYIAVLNGNGFPVLIKLATSLSADGTLVFEPGDGTDIGVQCGRFDVNTVWIAGVFGGTDVVEKSEDAGSTFTVKDTGAFGDVEAFIMGPDSDKRVLISDVTNDDIQETIDDGANWTQINSAVGFNINAIARLDRNVQETVFGNDLSATDNIDYSVNSGDDMEDYTTGDFPIVSDVTSVTVN